MKSPLYEAECDLRLHGAPDLLSAQGVARERADVFVRTRGAGGRVPSGRSSALRCKEKSGHPLRFSDRIVGQREGIECSRFQAFGPRAADRESPNM